MIDPQESRIPDKLPRCTWSGASSIMRAYHDTEWGTPVHDDRLLFEFLVLEGAEADLSCRANKSFSIVG